jgi:hypothetical protein
MVTLLTAQLVQSIESPVALRKKRRNPSTRPLLKELSWASSWKQWNHDRDPAKQIHSREPYGSIHLFWPTRVAQVRRLEVENKLQVNQAKQLHEQSLYGFCGKMSTTLIFRPTPYHLLRAELYNYIATATIFE